MVWKEKPAFCDHGFERSDLCAEIILILIIIIITPVLRQQKKAEKKRKKMDTALA